MEKEEKSLAIRPDKEVAFGHDAAKNLLAIIANKKKPVMFNGEQYLEFEDWQTLGRFFGLVVQTSYAQPVNIEGVKGAKASAKVFDRNGAVVGGAEAYCLSDEKNWAMKPFYQLASMAQTRAGAKSLRNILSWVAVLGGFRPTPAEEMEDVHNGNGAGPAMISVKQKNFVKGLVKQLGGTIEKMEQWAKKPIDEWNSSIASKVIEKLQAELDKRKAMPKDAKETSEDTICKTCGLDFMDKNCHCAQPDLLNNTKK